MRLSLKLAGVLIPVMVAGITGVQALFAYAGGVNDAFGNKNVVAQFAYAPEEVLPDSPEDKTNQTSHMSALDEVLFNTKMGMNMGKGDKIQDNIEQKGLLSYLDTVTGGQLKHLIDVSESAKNLGLTYEYIDEDSFYVYTYYRLDHMPGAYIIAYRTIIKRNSDRTIDKNNDGKMDLWVAAGSIKGQAPAVRYSGNQYRIDAEKWEVVIEV